MVTDPERMETVLEDVYVAISGERLSSADEVLPLLDQLIPTGKPLLLLGEHFAGDALRRWWSTSCAASSRRSPFRRRSTGRSDGSCTRTWRS